MTAWRRIAWIVVVVADVGLLLWGAMAALAPQYLIGPNGTPILTAGYQNFTGGSWDALVSTTPEAARFMTVLFRLYGVFNVAVGLLTAWIAATAYRRGDVWAWWALLLGNTLAYGGAMTYDRIVNAIGPFEILEYVAIILVYAALAATAPFGASRQMTRSTA